MSKEREPSEFSRKFIQHCDERSAKIAKDLLEDLVKVKKKDREGFIAFVLSDELVHFYHDALAFALKDTDGAKRFRSMIARRAGRASGEKRWNSSVKLTFIRWAIEENRRNPSLSKNAIANNYAGRVLDFV